MVIIFGGSFNPITLGHIDTSLSVSNKVNSDVLITPCFKNNFKNELVDSTHRLNMCKIAVKNYPNIKINSIEIDKQTSGSTLELIKLLKNINPETDFYFLIGMDNANSITTWKNYKELLDLTNFIVVPRKGYKEDKNIDWYKKEPHIYLSDCEIIETCSKDVRRYLKDKNINKIKNLLDKDVLDYILENNLY